MLRYNYTTPKSFLEFGGLYKLLLAQKRSDLNRDKERLENGVDKIAQASAQASANRGAMCCNVREHMHISLHVTSGTQNDKCCRFAKLQVHAARFPG